MKTAQVDDRGPETVVTQACHIEQVGPQSEGITDSDAVGFGLSRSRQISWDVSSEAAFGGQIMVVMSVERMPSQILIETNEVGVIVLRRRETRDELPVRAIGNRHQARRDDPGRHGIEAADWNLIVWKGLAGEWIAHGC